MSKVANRSGFYKRAGLRYWVLAAVWTACVGASMLWNRHEEEVHIINLARANAQVTFENDLLYRRWASSHGGVYVPSSDQSPPNPYLGVPDRDVTTGSGLALTLVNPAYMARQVNELAAVEGRIRGHLTSLRPVRPENAPDTWEAAALQAFEVGVTEASVIEGAGAGERLRFMRPFVTEKPCLKCHAVQGYSVGDIRGGISVTVPTAPLRSIVGSRALNISLAHLALWVLGLGGLAIMKGRLDRESRARERAQDQQSMLLDELRVKNRDLNEFAYAVAHDLKAPLRAASMLAECVVADSREQLDGRGREQLVLMIARMQRMHRLVDDVLAYSRLGRIEDKPVSVNLGDVVTRALERVAPPDGITVTVESVFPTVTCDPGRMQQVFQNLIGNAVAFMDKPRGEIRVGCERAGRELRCHVADNGPGIEEKHHERIFKIFQTLAPPDTADGTGIGLAIVKRIVEGHGGRVWVESRAGAGSTFYFTLPAGRADAP